MKDVTISNNQITITFKAGDRRFATCIRHFIASYSTLNLHRSQSDAAYNVAMIANELVQNALNYSLPDTQGKIEIRYFDNKIVVSTVSTPQPEHYERLEDTLDQVEDAPEDFYLQQVQDPDNSRLGLVRIANDFKAITLVIQENERVKVRTTYSIPTT